MARTISDRMALLGAYRVEVLGSMLAGAALAAVMGYFVVRRAMRPIKAIARQARSIAAQRLATRLDAHSVPNELQTLVESFNAVLDRLQESFQRLSQFSADLAHDLRTPLYNLTMQTQVALLNHVLAKNINRYYCQVWKSTNDFRAWWKACCFWRAPTMHKLR